MNFNVTPSEASVAGCRITATPISKNLKWLSDPHDDATVQTLTGTQYILTAHPAPGWKFKEYSGSRQEYISGDGITPYTRTTYFYTSDNPTIDYADREPGNGNVASSAQMFVGTGVSTLRKIDGSGETYTIRCYSEDYGTVDALFEASDDITISILASPSNGGSTTGGGLYNSGDTVTITAVPNENYSFERWTKDGATVSYDPKYIFTATKSETYVAVFTNKYITFRFRNGYGEPKSGIKISIDGMPKSATTDSNGVAKLYGKPDGMPCTYVITNYMTKAFLTIWGTCYLASVKRNGIEPIRCHKRINSNDFVIWDYESESIDNGDVIEFLSTKPFYVGCSLCTLGGKGWEDPNADERFLNAFSGIRIFELYPSSLSGGWRDLAYYIYRNGMAYIAAQGCADIISGSNLPAYAYGAISIDIPQECFDKYSALGVRPILKISKNTIYGHLNEESLELSVGRNVFYTCYDDSFVQDRIPKFAADNAPDGCAFAYIDIKNIGIIYDPESNNIMSDNSAILYYA